MADPDDAKYDKMRRELDTPDPTLPDVFGNEEIEPEQRRGGITHEPDDDGPEWRRTYADRAVYSHYEADQITDDFLFSDYVGDEGPGVLAEPRGASPKPNPFTHAHEQVEIDGRVVDVYRSRA